MICLKDADDEIRKRKCRLQSGKAASQPLLLPRCHFESIKGLHASARLLCTHNNHYHLHSQINVMAKVLDIKKLIILIKGPKA